MTNTSTNPIKGKKIVERSASYPSTPLEDAISFVGTIAKNFTPQHVITREDISAVTKVKTVHRITAAAAQYGLLLRVKNGYKVSQLYKDFLNPVSAEEQRSILLNFFRSPKLYSELIDSYNEHVVPPELKSILVRNHKIASNVAAEVADIFIKNAQFVGALNDSGILSFRGESVSKSDSDRIKPEPTLTLKESDSIAVDNIMRIFDGQEDVKVVLTEGKYCFIKYPKNINDKDVLILKKWIELLELTLK